MVYIQAILIIRKGRVMANLCALLGAYMCQQNISLLSIGISFLATVLLSFFAITGVTLNLDGSVSMTPSSYRNKTPEQRKSLAQFQRFALWAGISLLLISFAFQVWAIYTPTCIFS